MLVQEISELKGENEQLLDEKQKLQKDMQVGTDYCVQLEEKCFKAHKTSLDLLQQMRTLDEDNRRTILNLHEDIRTLKSNHWTEIAEIKE